MEIKNTTLMEEKLFVGFQRFSSRIFKKSRTANLILDIVLAVIVALGVASIVAGMVILILMGENILEIALLLVLIALLGALLVFVKVFLPKIMYKKSPLKNVPHSYTFKNGEFNVEAKSEAIETSETLKYASITKAYETADAIFLYISPYQAMIIAKNGFASEEDLGKVKEALNAMLGKKYIMVK